jgi:hypothetical protein
MTDKKNDPGPSINITSHNQTGGVTAHTVHQTVNVGSPARHMTQEMGDQILSVYSPRPFNIACAMNDSEACSFAKEIEDFLIANGFVLLEAKMTMSFGEAYRPGVAMSRPEVSPMLITVGRRP